MGELKLIKTENWRPVPAGPLLVGDLSAYIEKWGIEDDQLLWPDPTDPLEGRLPEALRALSLEEQAKRRVVLADHNWRNWEKARRLRARPQARRCGASPLRARRSRSAV